ncbi:MAG: GNAT family N-acetyltransferase [Bacteroides sp.]|nr:GNAT family N-acetyltransferase [Bacteroides sp.]
MTQRITLRAPEPDDVDRIFLWENDLAMAEAAVNGAPVSRLQVWNYVQTYTADPFGAGELRLIIEADGRAAGHIDLIEVDARNRRAGIAIYIAPDERRRGLGAAALAEMIKYCRDRLDLHQVWAHVAVDNAASLALFRAVGFRPAGRLRSWLRRGGEWVDVVVMQYLRHTLPITGGATAAASAGD